MRSYNLGLMYTTGEGVPQNDTEAVRWFRMAADQGRCQGAVPVWVSCMTLVEGVPQNDTEAVRWFRMAADQGRCHGTEQSGCHVCHWRRHSQGLHTGLCLVEHCRGTRQRNGKGELENHHKRNDDCWHNQGTGTIARILGSLWT